MKKLKLWKIMVQIQAEKRPRLIRHLRYDKHFTTRISFYPHAILWGGYYCLHLADKQTEADRGECCPRCSLSQAVVGLGLKVKSGPWLKPVPLIKELTALGLHFSCTATLRDCRLLTIFLKESLLGLLAKIKCSICSYQFNIFLKEEDWGWVRLVDWTASHSWRDRKLWSLAEVQD